MTDKLLVGKGVADKLRTAEVSIDRALCDAAKLLESMIAARGELRLAAEVGNGTVVKMTEALAALSQARSAVVDTHSDLKILGQRIGIKTAYLGWEDTKNASLADPANTRMSGARLTA